MGNKQTKNKEEDTSSDSEYENVYQKKKLPSPTIPLKKPIDRIPPYTQNQINYTQTIEHPQSFKLNDKTQEKINDVNDSSDNKSYEETTSETIIPIQSYDRYSITNKPTDKPPIKILIPNERKLLSTPKPIIENTHKITTQTNTEQKGFIPYIILEPQGSDLIEYEPSSESEDTKYEQKSNNFSFDNESEEDDGELRINTPSELKQCNEFELFDSCTQYNFPTSGCNNKNNYIGTLLPLFSTEVIKVDLQKWFDVDELKQLCQGARVPEGTRDEMIQSLVGYAQQNRLTQKDSNGSKKNKSKKRERVMVQDQRKKRKLNDLTNLRVKLPDGSFEINPQRRNDGLVIWEGKGKTKYYTVSLKIECSSDLNEESK